MNIKILLLWIINFLILLSCWYLFLEMNQINQQVFLILILSLYLIQFATISVTLAFAYIRGNRLLNEIKLTSISIWSFTLFLWSLFITSMGDLYDGIYLFPIPFILVSFFCFISSLISLLKKQFKYIRIISIIHSFLFVFFLYAAPKWGGNDGPGMAWVIFVGLSSILAIPNGLITFFAKMPQKIYQ